jgi:polyhydroxybutyrate depolymerase
MRHNYLKIIPVVFFLLTAWLPPHRQFSGYVEGQVPTVNSLIRGDHNFEITVDGLKRTYILHVPPAIRANKPLPLIVVLHGTYGTGRKMEIGLGFDPYADERNFYVAYPDAYQDPGKRQTARWNDGRGTIESAYKGIDDVKFITAMIEDIGAQVPLDRARVYVTGASNGGMMTYRLGCETRGLFAGIAPDIGNIPEPIFSTCAPSAPLDLLAINGDKDPFVPFDGGEVCPNVPKLFCEKGMVKSQAESVGKFAAANGCDAAAKTETLPVKVQDGTSIELQTYGNCTNGARVEAYVVRNGGHTWPPRESQVESGGKATGNLDATQEIVDFFIGPSK